MSIIEINVEPLISCEFQGLPTLNTYFNLHYHKRRVTTAEWRYEAREKALDEIGFRDTPLVKNRALVIVSVMPPFEEVSDIHNVVIKPILDGFSDAGLWVDDEWAWVPLVMYKWGGISDRRAQNGRKQRVSVIDVYELGTYTEDGHKFVFPKGRVRTK